MLIRPEAAADALAIRELTARAFAGMRHSDGSEPDIIDRLRASRALAVSLVAEENGQVIGHVAVSPVAISDGSLHWYGLGPISVEPRIQRSGVGSRLVNVALEALRVMGASGCVVLGDPAYYKRFGFSQEHGLLYPGPPAEYFMALQLASPRPRGQVEYHCAFGEA